MKKHSYFKKTFNEERFEAICLKILDTGIVDLLVAKKRLIIGCMVALLVLPFAMHLTSFATKNVEISDNDFIQITSISAGSSSKRGVISIPKGAVNKNPFLPYRDIGDDTNVVDVPDSSLTLPPMISDETSEAARVMKTVVSGILYDKYSPSAILNIEGTDYLVKKGDVVNNYRVLSITQDSVTVKLGSNTYKAGIGEILTSGDVNKNDVANLNNKFGGGR